MNWSSWLFGSASNRKLASFIETLCLSILKIFARVWQFSLTVIQQCFDELTLSPSSVNSVLGSYLHHTKPNQDHRCAHARDFHFMVNQYHTSDSERLMCTNVATRVHEVYLIKWLLEDSIWLYSIQLYFILVEGQFASSVIPLCFHQYGTLCPLLGVIPLQLMMWYLSHNTSLRFHSTLSWNHMEPWLVNGTTFIQ